MHSRIFQLEETPIEKDDYIDSSYFDDSWFVEKIADYVCGCDREDAINWLKACEKGYTVGKDDNGEYVLITDKKEYFKSAYERFRKSLDALRDATLDDFAEGKLEVETWMLKESYNERFGFYACFKGDLYTFDCFVRMAKANKKYYLGEAIDYHY